MASSAETPRAVIYKIRNLLNQNFYVGSSINNRVRFRQHRRLLRKGVHHCKHLQAAWNKYGEDVFVFEVVEVVDVRTELALLQTVENRWLLAHVGKAHCYNSGYQSDAPWRGAPKTAHPNFGRAKTAEQRAEISATLKAYYAEAPENHPRYGKTLSKASRAKISANRKGKMTGADHYRFGTGLSDEVRKKIGDTQRGVPKAPRMVSEEGLAKIRASAAAGNYSHFTGKQHTEESKTKMRRQVKCTAPDGETSFYPSITMLRHTTGLLAPTLNRALKSGLPLAKGPYTGWRFEYC